MPRLIHPATVIAGNQRMRTLAGPAVFRHTGHFSQQNINFSAVTTIKVNPAVTTMQEVRWPISEHAVMASEGFAAAVDHMLITGDP